MALGAIAITGAPGITTPPGSLREPTLYHDLRPSLQLAQERLLTHEKILSHFHPKSRARVTIGHLTRSPGSANADLDLSFLRREVARFWN